MMFVCITSSPYITLWLLATILLVLHTTVSGQSFNPIRINCGGNAFTDTGTNITWIKDTYNFGNKGKAKNTCSNTTVITNTTATLRPLYCIHRYYRTTGTILDVQPYQYVIPVLSTPASYIVRLHLAETVRSFV